MNVMKKHQPSLLPEGKKWKLVWSDEFDGPELDTGKWSCRLHMMQRRHYAWSDQDYSFDGKSSLRLELKKHGLQFTSTQLQTGENYLDRPPEDQMKIFSWKIADFSQPKFLKKYGYFECRCKLPTQPGWWAAFWLQSPQIGCCPDPARAGIEIDIMENFTRDGEYSHNIYWNGYGKAVKSGHSGPRHLESDIFGWHVYGVDWNSDGYIFYVDGKETWRFNEAVSHTEQFIMLSTECKDYRYNGMPAPELQNAKLPDAFIVDYVRVYDEVNPKIEKRHGRTVL